MRPDVEIAVPGQVHELLASLAQRRAGGADPDLLHGAEPAGGHERSAFIERNAPPV
jgi:hypothetical protein